MNSDLIADVIRLAVAPVFLLAGIGALMNVLTARLGRVVDRVRVLEDRLATLETCEERDRLIAELPGLERRMSNANRAIFLSTASALMTCLLVMMLFVGEFIPFDVSFAIAALFTLAMAAMSVGLCFFLVELSIANRMLHVRSDVLALAKRD